MEELEDLKSKLGREKWVSEQSGGRVLLKETMFSSTVQRGFPSQRCLCKTVIWG